MEVQFCTQCGTALPTGARYCPSCRFPVEDMVAVGDEPGTGDQPGTEPDAGPSATGGPGAWSSAGSPWATGAGQAPRGEPPPPMTLGTLFFSPNGRINRARYWLGSLPLIAVQLVANAGVMNGQDGWLLVSLLLTYPSLMLGIKRAHDRDWGAWFVLLGFVPILMFWPFIELGFLRGTPGPNRFGPDPLAGKP